MVRFVIYGAGAIGGLTAALLCEAGHDVVVIARGAHADAIASNGITIESALGRRTTKVNIVRTPAEVGLQSEDAVLMGMKSQDAGAALLELRRAAGPEAPDLVVACLQNGVDNERSALRLFPQVYGVLDMCPASHLEPGVIQQNSVPVPGMLDVGRFPYGTDANSAALAAAFRSAGFESTEQTTVMRWKYRKLLMNLGNAVEALIGGPESHHLAKRAREEGEACFAAASIDCASAQEDAERRGDTLKLVPIDGQSRGGGSSWQSLSRGLGSIESDYLNGEIALLGRLYGVPAPVNALLQELASEAAWRRDPPGRVTVEQFEARLAGDPV